MKYIFEGVPSITIPVLILCTVSLIVLALIIILFANKKQAPGFLYDTIPMLGLASFSYPFIRLLIGLFQAADSITQGGEISSSLVWEGVSQLGYNPVNIIGNENQEMNKTSSGIYFTHLTGNLKALLAITS